MDFPELLGNEGANLPLALDDQAHGHGLNPARRESPGDLRPEQRRHHIADHAVEEAPGLLRIHPVRIQLRGMLEGLADGVLRDLVEHDPLVAVVVAADGLAQMPGDGLPLPVEVGREVDGVGLLRQLPELTDHLLLAGQDLVVRFPAMLRVDTHAAHELLPVLLPFMGGFFLRGHLAGARRLGSALFRVHVLLAAAGGRQVADVAHAGLHHEIRPEVLVDGLGLRRRLDDDERLSHGAPVLPQRGGPTGEDGAKGRHI